MKEAKEAYIFGVEFVGKTKHTYTRCCGNVNCIVPSRFRVQCGKLKGFLLLELASKLTGINLLFY
jgi:hypothetical protein